MLACGRAIHRDCHQRYQIGYDPLYRLTDLIQGSTLLEHFDYDATGNRTAANIGGTAQNYAYPADSHRLERINGISRDYDNAGNTTLRDGLNYTYNGRNRLSRVSMGRTTYYAATYNARGEREEKTLTAGMTTQRFIYDEAGRLIQTGNVPKIGLTRTLKPEQRLLWLDDQLVGVKLMKVESNAYAGELLYAHTDHLGTPRALTRPSNNNSTVWRWPLETTAFGQHPAQTDPDGDGQALTFNLRYPGQYFDAESGLHYNYFRDYEAGVGRYVESDPIGLRGGVSTYGYGESAPFYFRDPFGMAACVYTISAKKLVCVPQNPSNPVVDIAVASGNNGENQQCKDNAECISQQERGPIPIGNYTWNVNGPGSANSKPNGRRLVPSAENEMYGRSGFLTHSCLNAFGPALGPQYCSKGCITGSVQDIQRLNELLGLEPDSTLVVEE